MTSILEHDPMLFKKDGGFDFPEFYEYYEKAVASVWRHQEVAMESDLRDWQFNSTPEERNVIAGILKGFVSAELGIGCYWADKVCSIFQNQRSNPWLVRLASFRQSTLEPTLISTIS